MPYDLRKKRRLGPTWWLIKKWDYSMAWFKGKASPETMGFSQQWGFPLDFPLNQSSYPIGDDNNPAGIFRILTSCCHLTRDFENMS
jgi:hypothetical protein